MLVRYDSDGQIAGDTSHLTEEEAREQATFEFGPGLGEWRPIPAEVITITEFVMANS